MDPLTKCSIKNSTQKFLYKLCLLSQDCWGADVYSANKERAESFSRDYEAYCTWQSWLLDKKLNVEHDFESQWGEIGKRLMSSPVFALLFHCSGWRSIKWNEIQAIDPILDPAFLIHTLSVWNFFTKPYWICFNWKICINMNLLFLLSQPTPSQLMMKN